MGNETIKGYRVRRPKLYEELLILLRDKEVGVFSTFKSALVFAAAVGYKHKRKLEFTEVGEPIALTLFNENFDQPFIYSLALSEYQDVSYLQEDRFTDTIRLFEEYAAGGLAYLSEVLDLSNIKESVEGLVADSVAPSLVDDISSEW